MHRPVTDPADELLATYSASGGINYLEAAAMLPSRAVVESACAELMSLMFPGFHGEPLVLSRDLPDVTRSRIKRLHTRVKPEIAKCLGSNEAADDQAEEILSWFMSQLAAPRQLLWTDIDAAFEGDPAARNYEEIIV